MIMIILKVFIQALYKRDQSALWIRSCENIFCEIDIFFLPRKLNFMGIVRRTVSLGDLSHVQ